MKVAQLVEKKMYVNKKQNEFRFACQITETEVYFITTQDHFVHHVPKQDFAGWANKTVPGERGHLDMYRRAMQKNKN